MTATAHHTCARTFVPGVLVRIHQNEPLDWDGLAPSVTSLGEPCETVRALIGATRRPDPELGDEASRGEWVTLILDCRVLHSRMNQKDVIPCRVNFCVIHNIVLVSREPSVSSSTQGSRLLSACKAYLGCRELISDSQIFLESQQVAQGHILAPRWVQRIQSPMVRGTVESRKTLFNLQLADARNVG